MENKPTFKLSLILVLSCIYFLSTNLAVAQDKNIYEITENRSSNDRKEFYSLAFNLGTTVYLENNSEKSLYGNNSISKINMLDTRSFEFLKSNEAKYNSAELIVIDVSTINELNNSYDLTGLTEMNHLKYIYIKCSFKCQKSDIENFVKVNPSIRVFYNAQNPS